MFALQNNHHNKICQHLSLHSYLFIVGVVRTVKIYSLSNFEVYTIVLLTVITRDPQNLVIFQSSGRRELVKSLGSHAKG